MLNFEHLYKAVNHHRVDVKCCTTATFPGIVNLADDILKLSPPGIKNDQKILCETGTKNTKFKLTLTFWY